ncbi:MAG: MFS transporter small subunit [Micromonosporaceae bacterium]
MSTEHHVDHRARIAASWSLVGIPLAYGIYNALEAALQLFTG